MTQGFTVRDLEHYAADGSIHHPILLCPLDGGEYSANPADYFWMPPDVPFACEACGEYLLLGEQAHRV